MFDSMIAKLIVTGATRTQAVERARRALRELEVEGIPTVVPFHRAVLESEAFVPAAGEDATAFGVHTRWIETEFTDELAALAPAAPAAPVDVDDVPDAEPERVVVEVGGRRLEVVLPAGLGMARARTANAKGGRRPARRTARSGGPAATGATLASPMQGTIVKVAVAEGDVVAEGDLVVVLEAMKMEQPLVAHRSGTVKGLALEPGAGVSAGTTICDIVDEA
jgi:acetyl-CoA/propionyl-CoA carboxylase biotin carboxyl carrier protein